MKLIMENWKKFLREEEEYHATDAADENILFKQYGGRNGREIQGVRTYAGEDVSMGEMMAALHSAGRVGPGDIEAVEDSEKQLGEPMNRWPPEEFERYGFNLHQIAQAYADWMQATLKEPDRN